MDIFEGYEFKQGQLQDAINESIKFMNGKSSWGKTLQYVGTNVFREKIDANFWINVWTNKFEKCKTNGVIVTDARFKNEANLLKKLGFELWKVQCPIEERKKRIKTVRDENHISETDLDDYDGFDVILQNDSTLKELEEAVYRIYYNVK